MLIIMGLSGHNPLKAAVNNAAETVQAINWEQDPGASSETSPFYNGQLERFPDHLSLDFSQTVLYALGYYFPPFEPYQNLPTMPIDTYRKLQIELQKEKGVKNPSQLYGGNRQVVLALAAPMAMLHAWRNHSFDNEIDQRNCFYTGENDTLRFFALTSSTAQKQLIIITNNVYNHDPLEEQNKSIVYNMKNLKPLVLTNPQKTRLQEWIPRVLNCVEKSHKNESPQRTRMLYIPTHHNLDLSDLPITLQSQQKNQVTGYTEIEYKLKGHSYSRFSLSTALYTALFVAGSYLCARSIQIAPQPALYSIGGTCAALYGAYHLAQKLRGR
jgi:hypothetical protein